MDRSIGKAQLMAAHLTDEELEQKVAKAIEEFGGYMPSLEGAIGALYVGKSMGWQVLYIVHSPATIRKYEKILGLKFKDQMERSTELSKKSWAWVWADKFDAFWRLVRGQEKSIDRTKLERQGVNAADVQEEGNRK